MWYNTQTTSFCRSLKLLRSMYPNRSIGAAATQVDDWVKYSATPQPAFNPITHVLAELPPVFNSQSGIWEQVWSVHELEAEDTDLRDALVLSIRNEIKAIRDHKTAKGGAIVNGTWWFHTDTVSQVQQLMLYNLAKNIEAEGGDLDVPFMSNDGVTPLMWKTMGDVFVPMTPNLVLQVTDAAKTQAIALFAYAEYLQAQVINAEDPRSIDIQSGWPETFTPS